MTFPTVRGIETTEGIGTSLPMPIPTGFIYNATDLIVAFLVGATRLDPSTIQMNFEVDVGSPWKPAGGAVHPYVKRLWLDVASADLTATSPSSGVAGSGHLVAVADADLAGTSLIGQVQDQFGHPSSYNLVVTPNMSLLGPWPTDALLFVSVGVVRGDPANPAHPDLAPLATVSTVTSSTLGTWTEVASTASTPHRLFQLDGGLPAGTGFTGGQNLASFLLTSPYLIADVTTLSATCILVPFPQAAAGWQVGHLGMG